MEYINGGVCAAKGYTASGIHCGIRKNKGKKDLALILTENAACAAAVYTKNQVKGAPLLVTRKNLQDGKARAVICNSGNANTCNENGIQIAEDICELLAKATNISPDDVIVASTGVIGQPLDIMPIESGIPKLVELLGNNSSDAAEAIMTTDLSVKEVAVEFMLNGKPCRIGGIAKGSGMIHPNMATMLSFLTTDTAISSEMLQKALSLDIEKSFNMISIDGDTSTNDMVSILANGLAENSLIKSEGKDYDTFCLALNLVTTYLCRAMAKDGEGATKLIECIVLNAINDTVAKTVAKTVVCSNLVKTAMFGADANWGRVLCAIGYSGATINANKIDVAFKSAFGSIQVCRNGAGVNFNEDDAKRILLSEEITIIVDLNDGIFSATAWGCDLTYDYVKINGDYRT